MRILRQFVAEDRKFRPGDEQMLIDSGLDMAPLEKDGSVDRDGKPAPKRPSPVELAAKVADHDELALPVVVVTKVVPVDGVMIPSTKPRKP